MNTTIISSSKKYDGTMALSGALSSSGRGLNFDMIAFGAGTEILVLLPGLSDGLASVKGKSALMSYAYRCFAKVFRVLCISRPQNLPEPYSTRQMASDYAALLRQLGCSNGNVRLWGVSMGGMIAQWIAVDYGELVHSACLDVTTAKASSTTKQVLDAWITLAKARQHGKLMRDTMRKTYTSGYLKRYQWLMPFLGLVSRPKSYNRFLIQANACLGHDALGALGRMKIPCLVAGGDNDQIVGPGAAEELAAAIPTARLQLYAGLGHGAYEEAKGHNDLVLNFFVE